LPTTAYDTPPTDNNRLQSPSLLTLGQAYKSSSGLVQRRKMKRHTVRFNSQPRQHGNLLGVLLTADQMFTPNLNDRIAQFNRVMHALPAT